MDNKNSDNEIILEILKEMREDQKELVDKSALHREETFKWQTEADVRLDRIEVDLREHKEGVIQNRSALAKFNIRLEELEQPKKAQEYVRKQYMKWSAVIATTLGIATGIAKIMGLW